MKISAFVIDCDGTLVDSERLWTIAKRETAERWGAAWSEDLRTSLLGTPLRDCAERISSVTPERSPWESIAEDLTSSFRRVLASSPVDARDGAKDLLLALADRQTPVAVASNGQQIDVELALERAGLRPLVAVVLCPEGSRRAKPEPDLYLAACEGLDVPVSGSIAIEDAPLGVLSARRAGLLTLGLATPGDPAVEADLEISTLWPLDFSELELALEQRQAGV